MRQPGWRPNSQKNNIETKRNYSGVMHLVYHPLYPRLVASQRHSRYSVESRSSFPEAGSTTRNRPSGATPTAVTALPSSLISSGSDQSTHRENSDRAALAESVPEAQEHSFSVRAADSSRTACSRRRWGRAMREMERWRWSHKIDEAGSFLHACLESSCAVGKTWVEMYGANAQIGIRVSAEQENDLIGASRVSLQAQATRAPQPRVPHHCCPPRSPQGKRPAFRGQDHAEAPPACA